MTPPSSLIIAVDGPAAAGKGTLARRLAAHYALAYLDTGLLYRATGLAVVRAGGDPDREADAVAAARALTPAALEDPALRGDVAADAASRVAAQPAVRTALLERQRHFAHHPPPGKQGSVLDGRDIGTVVCPEAPVKLFVTADVAVRAERRVRELQERGMEAIPETILAEMRARDARDGERAAAPLRPADDAEVVDTTHLDADAAFARAVALVDARRIPSA